MQQFSDISQADAANSICELLDNLLGGKLDRHRSEIANYRPFSQEHATKSVRGRFHGANVIELERIRSALGVGVPDYQVPRGEPEPICNKETYSSILSNFVLN